MQPGAVQLSVDEAARLDLGGRQVRLRSKDAAWRRLARERFTSFATASLKRTADASSVDHAITVDYAVIGDSSKGDEPSPEDLYLGRRQALLGRRREDDGLDLAGGGFTARIAAEGRRVEIVGPRAIYPLDRTLQALCYELGDGLVVHAAAFAAGGRGWLCAGASGCGKSTLAGLFPEYALCEELALVRPVDGGYDLVGLPFWHGRPGRARLAGVHLLRHGRRHRRRRLSPSAAFSALRREISWPTWDASLLATAFAHLGELCERLPVYELAFRPEREVWPVLSAPPAPREAAA